MAATRISIALCTYNGAPYLADQLSSIAAQTKPPFEVVITDDRSTDATPDLLARFAREAPFPVTWSINEGNLGSTKNFERAISACTGDAIALADQDDVWESTKIQQLQRAFEASPETGLVFSDAELVNEQLERLGYTLWQGVRFSAREQAMVRRGRAFDVLLRHNVVTGTAMAFASRFRDAVLPIPADWVQDGWIALLIAALGDCRMIETPLIRYRQHAVQQLGGTRQTFLERIAKATRMDYGSFVAVRDRYAAALERLRQFEDRLRDPGVLGRLEAKVAHWDARARMRRRPVWRYPMVASELVRLRYSRYSSDVRCAVQDLLL
jgi:glycosyltransferase involved in cell wall biosynthesis